MSNPNTKPVVAALCAVLLAGPALAQGNPQTNQPNQNPAASPVQGAQTGMSRSPDTTSPSTRDPALSGGQVTDGRSPGTVSGPTGSGSTRGLPNTANTEGRTTGMTNPSTAAGHPSGIRNDNVPMAPGGNATRPSGTQGSAITSQPPGGTGTNLSNQPPGGAGTSITNAPVGAGMDGSQGGRAAAANDSDRRDGSAPLTASEGGRAPAASETDRDRRDGTANIAPAAGQRSGEVPGANSFTEGQARSRMEGAGLSQVGELRKDDNGVWRGVAMRDGRQVQVSMDYQGNVTHR